MAITYNVDELRTNRSLDFSGSRDEVSVTWNNEYRVSATGTGTISPYDAITATGLPVVNRSVYYFDGKIIPYVICRKKKLKQNPKRTSEFTVTASYKAALTSGQEESDNDPIAPPALLTDITAREVPILKEVERVMYKDKAGDEILTPLKRFFADPVIERVPTLTLEISQYESSVTYEQLLARKLRVNDATYRTKAAHKWLIQHIEPVEVDVELSGGTTTAVLCKYTVELNDTDQGWKEQRVLVDTHFVDGSGDIQPFQDGELLSQNYGFIQSDGTKKAGSTPDYVSFEVYDTATFSGFLQV